MTMHVSVRSSNTTRCLHASATACRPPTAPFTVSPCRSSHRGGRRSCVVPLAMLGGMGNLTPQAIQEALKDPKMQEMMKKAMADPAIMKKVQEMQAAMANPEVQKQMQAMQAFQQNEALKKRMEELKDDPELAEMFKDIKANGQAAIMKYYNDPKILAKIGSRISDVVPAAGVAGEAAAGAATAGAAPIEINNLLDAAKYGDIEAVEDFLAIGKDVKMKDAEGRTALHYACGFGHDEIARMLMESGGEVEAEDTKGNTPLHYAAGYGRPDLTRLMVDAGANRSAKNSTGKTPADLVAAAPQNPINQDVDLCKKLRP